MLKQPGIGAVVLEDKETGDWVMYLTSRLPGQDPTKAFHESTELARAKSIKVANRLAVGQLRRLAARIEKE